MKKLVFAFLLVGVYVGGLMAQDRERRDSLAFTDHPHRPFLLSILEAPVLEGMSEPRIILPNVQLLCYDKTITFKTTTPSGEAQGCLFIDTEGGFMSFIPPKRGESPDCTIKPEEEKFNLTVMGLAGNSYHYFNYRNNSTLYHGVTNTGIETTQISYTHSPEPIELRKTELTKEFLGGKVKAFAYKVTDRTELWYLFGKELPDKVNFAPKKYLGNFGIGYQQAEEGLFLIMEVEGSPYDAQIVDIRDEQNCFDSRPFKPMETEIFERALESNEREKQKVEQQAQKINSEDYCAGVKQRNLQFKQEVAERKEGQLRAGQSTAQSRLGQPNQQSAATYQSFSQTMFNFDDMIQESIYDIELRICEQEKMLTYPGNANSPSTVQRIRAKIECLKQEKQGQISMKEQFAQMDAANSSYPQLPYKKLQQLSTLQKSRCN